MNGLTGAPNVMPPFALGLGSQLTQAAAYAAGAAAMPNMSAFSLAGCAGAQGALGGVNPAALRGFSNVLLVSNLNEEVS